MAYLAFARRLLQAMRAVVREAGHPSAYPPTRGGRLAALRQELKAMDEDRWFFNDVQRTLVLQEIRRLHTEAEAHHSNRRRTTDV
jgi:hypothetical protein